MRSIPFIALSLCSVFLARAGLADTTIPTTAQKSLDLAIYNQDIALVTDTRNALIQQGTDRISFENISDRIIPQSALLLADGVRTIEQNFDYDLITRHSLLKKAVGTNVILQRVNPDDGSVFETDALLLAYNNAEPVLMIDGNIVTEPNGTILLKRMPAGLIATPSLSLLIAADKTNTKTLALNYLTNGLSWQADYVAELNETETGMNLNGFITLTNTTASAFENASVRLVAGDVHLAPKPVFRTKGVVETFALNTAGIDSADMAVQDVADFYVYSLPVKTTVNANQTKQVSLLSRTDVPITKKYVFDNRLQAYGSPLENIKATIEYAFDNTIKSKLGIALPKGIIRFYKKAADNQSVFLGENRIDHTPNTATVRLQMGEAFDVFANAKRTSHTKSAPNVTVSAYEITLKNGSKEPKEVTVFENFFGNWTLNTSSLPYERITANRVSWTVTLAPESQQTLTYQIKQTGDR